jgi:uncharacterized protein (TIGR03089 family)
MDLATPGSSTVVAQQIGVSAPEPMLTYCDDATGERTELSVDSLGAWVARTAALLRNGCGLTTGARVAVLLPPHWTSAAVLLGAWSVGLTVSWRSWATAGLNADQQESTVDAVFVARERVDNWLETVPEAPHRFVLCLPINGAASADVPTGYRDYFSEVANYSDLPPAYEAVRPGDSASPDGTTFGEWSSLALGLAEMMGLRSGDRLLVDATATEQPVRWLLAPLTVGASIILCANLDPATVADRAAAEGATHTLA